jgi:hypothetical protein
MFGLELHWLPLSPLVRGALLTVALAALCLSAPFRAPAAAAALSESAAIISAAESPGTGTRTAWPSTVLRLWLLAPQLLLDHDR